VLEEALLALGIEPSMTPGDGRPLAIGWATVELDRAARELGAALSVTFVGAPDSVLLGAACRRSSITFEGLHVLLLEPVMEGRLAATLARRGEGWAAAWWGFDDAAHPLVGSRSRPRPGPLGTEVLLLGDRDRVPDRALRLVVGSWPLPDPGLG
jgi:hypothetical protein